jgi:ABC-type nitrate/sulfonate/bicarbonate transport system substrate-binding protein
VSKKEIKDIKQLKGKKIAGSSPGGSATLIAEKVLKHYGLEPGRDVSLLPMGGSAAGRYAVLENGVVDASFLSVPENIIALGKRVQRTGLRWGRCRVSSERLRNFGKKDPRES